MYACALHTCSAHKSQNETPQMDPVELELQFLRGRKRAPDLPEAGVVGGCEASDKMCWNQKCLNLWPPH